MAGTKRLQSKRTPRLRRRTASSAKKSKAAVTIMGPPLLRRFVRDGVAIEVAAIADAFGISKSKLAETIGVSREAFYKQARSDSPKTQTRLLEMLEVLARVSEWAGGEQQAMAWYRAQPLAAFGGRTAESLVKTGQAATLRDYLDHIAVGGYA